MPGRDWIRQGRISSAWCRLGSVFDSLESGRMTAPWTRETASASGQEFEFRLWAALVEQSLRQLHVFLPLADRGVNAMVHRLWDGTYLRVLAKGRSTLRGGEVHLVVSAIGLVDDDARLAAGLIVEGGLGPTMLAVPVREFKRLAEPTSADGELMSDRGRIQKFIE